MTPNQKSEELINKFYDTIEDHPVQCGVYCQGGSIDRMSLAKQCAKIAVEEILYALQVPPIENKGHLLYDSQIQYWNEVLTHLNT